MLVPSRYFNHTHAPLYLTLAIPTNDNSSPVKSASPAGGSRAQVEKEGATFAARAVSSKLQVMQLAEKERCRKRNEQKMAERLAAQLTEVADDDAKKEEELRIWTLDMAEKQEQHKGKLEEEGEMILQRRRIWRGWELRIRKRR